MAPSRPAARLTAVALAAMLTAGCAAAIVGSPQRGQSASLTTSSAPPPPTESTAPESTGTTPPEPTDPAAQQPGPLAPESSDHEIPDSAVGLIAGAPYPNLAVEGATDSDVDLLATAALADLFHYYDEVYPTVFGTSYVPPQNLVSYDAQDPVGTVCGMDTYEFVNAFYMDDCDTVAWDRGVLLPALSESIGILAAPTVLAHEIGHDIQHQAGMPADTPTMIMEQQADCYAGAYWRWVYDGHSEYFAFNQTEGMRQLLLSLLAVKDPPMTPDDVQQYGTADNHGNGFDRTYAATLGYIEGPERCSRIDAAEINARLSEFTFDTNTPYQYGNVDITTTVLQELLATVDDYFTQTQPGYIAPTLTKYSGHQPPDCGGQAAPFPVAYCPTDNSVSYQLAEVRRIGTPTGGWESTNGDFSAIVILVTRYALAAMNAGHAPITGTNAGLQSLCYAGTWASWMRNPQGDYQLSPNDLDKAIYEILDSPIAGSDITGQTDATLIERIQAFGYGVTHTIPACFDAYVR